MERVEEVMIDPVCGEEVNPVDSDYQAHYRGKIYFFCSLNCQIDFQEAPERYVGRYA